LADKGITATSAVTGNPKGSITFVQGDLKIGDLIYLSVGTVKVTSNNGSASVTPTYSFVVTDTAGAIGDIASSVSLTTAVDVIEERIKAGESANTAATAYSGSASSTAGARTQALEVTTDADNLIVTFETLGLGSELDGAAINVVVKRKPAETSVASWTALALWEQEAAADTVTATLEDLGVKINGTNTTADDTMSSGDVLLTLTTTESGELSTIGDPKDTDLEDITSFKLAGSWVVSASNNPKLTAGKEVGVEGTVANMKHALGIGADVATAATAAEIKAAQIAIRKVPGQLPTSSVLNFGLNPIANTAAAAGTTPNLISKLAGI